MGLCGNFSEKSINFCFIAFLVSQKDKIPFCSKEESSTALVVPQAAQVNSVTRDAFYLFIIFVSKYILACLIFHFSMQNILQCLFNCY